MLARDVSQKLELPLRILEVIFTFTRKNKSRFFPFGYFLELGRVPGLA
jgi:hypothetical protein